MSAARSSIRLCSLVLLLCWICIIGSSSISSSVTASSFRGSVTVDRLQQNQQQQQLDFIRRRAMEDKRKEEDDEEDDEEEDNVFVLPTAAPTRFVVTAAPTTAAALTENEATTAATPPINESDNSDSTAATTSHNLLEFMMEIQGDALLDPTKETIFRFHLQQYLLEFLQSPYLQVSNIVETIRLDRPWTVTTPATRRRHLQDDTTTTSTSNAPTNLILQYQGQAILKETAGFWDSQPTQDLINEAQIAALEDTAALQDYFIDLHLENYVSTQDAVIFVRLQVGNRPRVQWDPEATWDKIAALNATQQENDPQEQQQPQEGGAKRESRQGQCGIDSSQLGWTFYWNYHSHCLLGGFGDHCLSRCGLSPSLQKAPTIGKLEKIAGSSGHSCHGSR